jgi:hypothetical protein
VIIECGSFHFSWQQLPLVLIFNVRTGRWALNDSVVLRRTKEVNYTRFHTRVQYECGLVEYRPPRLQCHDENTYDMHGLVGISTHSTILAVLDTYARYIDFFCCKQVPCD